MSTQRRALLEHWNSTKNYWPSLKRTTRLGIMILRLRNSQEHVIERFAAGVDARDTRRRDRRARRDKMRALRLEAKRIRAMYHFRYKVDYVLRLWRGGL